MRHAGIIAAAIVGLLVLTAVSWGSGVASRVANPDRAVGVYERFFDRCASIQALEDQRDSVTAELDATDDPKREARLRSARQAVEAQRARTITQYNADADAPTRGFLRSKGLPGRLDATDERTECAR